MCDAEDRLWDCEHELAAVAKKYEALGGDRAYAELGEPAGLRARLVRVGLLLCGEAWPPGRADADDEKAVHWARLVVLALERACQERESAP